MSAAPAAGFADPVMDAQRCFRALLDAMARPGTIACVPGSGGPLEPAMAAAILTLVDHETPFWLDPRLAAARDWVAFHCGAPEVSDIGACRFAVSGSLPDLSSLPAGTHEEPESSATVICRVDSLGSGPPLRLTGPGLREPALFRAEGLPADFVSVWTTNHALFPRGIDLILCAGERMTALPRSVAIAEA